MNDQPPIRDHLLRYVQRWDMRLRTTLLPLWIPRGVIFGLLIGVGIALFARLRPLLMPQQVLALGVAAALLCGMAAFLAVWFAPRPPLKAARYFDRTFGLKERTSTALEVASGSLPAPAGIDTLQAEDALESARQVRARDFLPFRVRRAELGIMVALVLVLGVLALTFNPQAAALAQSQAITEVIEDQVEKLREVKRDIESDPRLTEDDKRSLLKPIEEAISKLQQPGISQPEAVAEMNKAADALNDQRTQLNERQRQAAQESAQALSQSQATQGIAEPLKTGDLSGAAAEMRSLSAKLDENQLSSEQASSTADALERAAEALKDLNPQAAEALKRAAEALRKGDQKAAAEALRDAARALQNQQDQMDSTPQSQAAENAAKELQSGSDEVAQAGQPERRENQPGESRSGNPGTRSQPQPRQGDQAEGNPQDGTAGRPSSEQPGESGGDTGEMMDGQGSPNSGDQEGNLDGSGAPQDGGQPGDKAGGSSGNVPGSDGGTSGTGTGDGGAGNDVIGGNPNEQPINPNTNRGDGTLRKNDYIYAPSFVGGDGGAEVGLDGAGEPKEGDPVEEGDFTTNPYGKSGVKLGDAVGRAARQADEAMDLDRVPGALRGGIRDYFSGLQK